MVDRHKRLIIQHFSGEGKLFPKSFPSPEKNTCNSPLSAKVIVDYTREPFVFGPGNVRVTLDYNIRNAGRI